MALNEDAIVDINERHYRYFGGAGKMLLPSRATVEALIRRIPAGKLLTTDMLRQTLASQFDVRGTCPVTTKNALKAIANDADVDVPYWRVVKQNGELMAYYPGGVAAHAEQLEQEGFTINAAGKSPKVKDLKEKRIISSQDLAG